MIFEFWCRKCEKDVGATQYIKSKFCPNCGTYLVKRRKDNPIKIKSIKKTPKPPPIEIEINEIDLKPLFQTYLKFSPIAPGDGVVFKSVKDWIAARKEAYITYRNRLSIDSLQDLNYLKRNFKSWLLFRNNLSWTTLQRTGYSALDYPEDLAKLIALLWDEEIDIEDRMRSGLQGSEQVKGIGPGILTGLLHTFFDSKYCVWNSRTKDTLEILRYPVSNYSDYGRAYGEVNNKLLSMTKELDTDLTTIDGFMWFISKHVQFMQ